jgi:beta-glucosidase
LGANDVGMQSGGWTIEWQGDLGDITPGATTILQGIMNTVSPDTEVVYDAEGNFGRDVLVENCIVVVGEKPYAEGIGDSATLALSSADIELTESMRDRCQKLIVVLLSGRPLIVTNQIDNWDALVAAWLPGTEGQGVVDVLFGDRPFTGKLSFTWPRSVDQLPFDFNNLGTGDDAPLFPFGYGLTR